MLLVTNERGGGHAIQSDWDGRRTTLVYVRPVGTIHIEFPGPFVCDWVPELLAALSAAGAISQRPQSHAPVTQEEAEALGVQIAPPSPLG